MKTYENNFDYRERHSGPNWKDIFSDFISSLVRGIAQPIMEKAKERRNDFVKKIIYSSVMLIGGIFFLNGLAILINDLVNRGRWIGYVSIGIAFILIGWVKADR